MQEWFQKDGTMPVAASLLQDSDTQCKLKGVLAVSCLLRGCTSALVEFCSEVKGLPALLALVRAS